MRNRYERRHQLTGNLPVAEDSMRTIGKRVTRRPGVSMLVLLALLLGAVACRSEPSPWPTMKPTAHQPANSDQTSMATAAPVVPSATPVPPTAALSPVPPSATAVPPTATASRVISSPVPATSPSAMPTPLPPLSGSGGGIIAFQSDRDRQDEIYVMNADGSDQRLLVSNRGALDSMPAWSPDGEQIALASRERGRDFEICIVRITNDFQRVDGKASRRVTDNEYDDLHPTWSADGTQIAFHSLRGSYTEIYVINVDGTGERQLTDNNAHDQDPAWSPDGAKIAFISRRDGDYEIYVMNSDGTGARPLTNNGTNEWSPTWSPDGGQIAFISDRDGDRHLFVMDTDGNNPQPLTNASYPWNDDPAWSPDGSQIAFRSNRAGYVDIYVIKADGGSLPQQLTDNAESDQDRAPAWRPDDTHSDYPR